MAWLPDYNRRKAIATVLDDAVKTDFQLPVTVFKGSPVAVNQSLYFDGVNNYAERLIPKFPAGKHDLSIECWMEFGTTGFTDDGLWRKIFDIYDAATREVSLYIIKTAGSYYIRAQFHTGTAYYIESDAVSSATLYHLAFTYDADGDDGEGHGRMWFYLNNVKQTHNGDDYYDIGADPNYAQPLTIRMARDRGGTRYSELYLQEIRFSDSCRSSSEVSAAYNGGDGARLEADENTVALYHCDNGRWNIYDVAYDAGIFYASGGGGLEELANGNLIIYYYKADEHMGDYDSTEINYKISADGGKHWGTNSPDYNDGNEANIITSDATHCIVRGGSGKTASGKFILFYHESTDWTNASSRIRAFPPSADGTTWGNPVTIIDYDAEEDFRYGTGCRTIQVESKLFQSMQEVKQPGGVKYRVAGLWSPDDGETWGTWDYDGEGAGTQNAYTTIVDDEAKGISEPEYVYLGNGKILGLVRTDTAAYGNFYQIRSDDYGETWSALEDTGWWAHEAGWQGSGIHIWHYNGLIFAACHNRQTRDLEVKVVDANEVWGDAHLWQSASTHSIANVPTDWIGYTGILLHSDNTAPMFHLTRVIGDAEYTYQKLQVCVPQTPWDGKQSNDWTLYDDSKYDQALALYNGPIWTTGRFSSPPSDGYNQIFLGGNCLNAFTDIRPTKLDGTTKLYHYLESKTDGIVGEFAVEASKAGSVKLDTNANSEQKEVAVTDTYADVVFAVNDYVIIQDDDYPLGEVNKITAIDGDTDVLTMENNLAHTYTTAKNARVCHGIFISYDNSGETTLDATYHSGSNTFESFDDAEIGVPTDLWNENDAAWGDIEYSTAEWRRGAKSLKFIQTSGAEYYAATCDTFLLNLTDAIISFWAFHDEDNDFLYFSGRRAGLTAFLHEHGHIDASLYYQPGPIDTGWDYTKRRWEKYTMLCTASDDVVIWKQFRNIIATDSHENAWDYMDRLQLVGQPTSPNDYWYLDEIIVRQYAPTLTYDVGNETQRVQATGITSTEALGTPSVAYDQSVSPDAIASTETIGTLQINQTIHATAITSTEAFGTPKLYRGILLPSIPSAEAFGTCHTRVEVDPQDHEGSVGWADEAKAYDEDTGTYAYDNIPASSSSDWLTVNRDIALTSSMARVWYSSEGLGEPTVEVHRDGAWVGV